MMVSRKSETEKTPLKSTYFSIVGLMTERQRGNPEQNRSLEVLPNTASECLIIFLKFVKFLLLINRSGARKEPLSGEKREAGEQIAP